MHSRDAVLLALLVVAAMCAACARSGTALPDVPQPGTAQPVAAAISLPPPAELDKLASAGPNDSWRFTWGEDFWQSVPYNLVVAGTGATFQPQWSAPGNLTLGDAAYCIYTIGPMTGYTGPKTIRYGWNSAPVDWNNFYTAVANFTANRWDWFKPSSSSQITIIAWGPPYLSPSGWTYIAVVLLGTDEANLKWVVGGQTLVYELGLQSNLNNDPTQNLAPLTVNFHTYSVVVGADVAGYDWDFNGDGTYEIDGASSPDAQYIYPNPGLYTCTVRIHTTDGVAATDSLTFTAVDPANTGPVADLSADVVQGDAPLVVTLDASGSTDDGYIARHEWDLDNNGDFEYDTGVTPTLQHVFARRGVQAVILRVTDNDFATDTDSLFILCNTGWRTTVIDSGLVIAGSGDPPLSMTVTGGGASARACLAYYDYGQNDLYFARATAEDGSTWGPPVAPVNNADTVGMGVSMVTTQDTPLIAYGKRQAGSYDLMVVLAQNQSGSAWFLPTAIDNARDIGARNSLGLAGSTPILFSVENPDHSGNNVLLYYRAKNSFGTVWDAPVTVGVAPGGYMEGLDAGYSGGFHPYVSVAMPDGNTGYGSYSASDSLGSDWDFFDRISTSSFSATSTVIAGGYPAIAAGRTGQLGSLEYLHADDLDGKSWTLAPQVLADNGLGGNPSMSIVGGTPAIAYASFWNSDLWYLHATNATGTAWAEPHKVDSLAGVGGYCALASVNNQPVICYYDVVSQELRCAWWQN